MESFKGLEVITWGSIIRCKVYAFVSCKVNLCPYYFTNDLQSAYKRFYRYSSSQDTQ